MSDTLEVGLYIFVLSGFLGYAVITRVPGLLHTPLMSLTNALSAISIVGAVILAGRGHQGYATVLGTIAAFAATTNIVSGFLITDRMLKMFKRREPAKKEPETAGPKGVSA
jgi:NAD(P) transhydrogenase subunit alpha